MSEEVVHTDTDDATLLVIRVVPVTFLALAHLGNDWGDSHPRSNAPTPVPACVRGPGEKEQTERRGMRKRRASNFDQSLCPSGKE